MADSTIQQEAAALLAAYGYLEPIPLALLGQPIEQRGLSALSKVNPATTAAAAKKMFAFHGLPWSEANAARKVVATLAGPRCGVPDYLEAPAGGGLCKWPHDRISVSFPTDGLPLAPARVANAWLRAAKQWEAACGLEFVLEADTYGSRYNIAAEYAHIDGPGRTLAYSYLPCGASAIDTMAQRYDTGETMWDENYLYLCITHEVGHALGLSHSSRRTDVMYPSLQPLSGLGAGDVAEARARYGPPKGAPPTPVPVPPDPEPIPPGPDPKPPADGPKWIDSSGAFELVLRARS